MLKVIDTGAIWQGEKVRGITYSAAIEGKFSDEELSEAGFERVTPPPAEPEPELPTQEPPSDEAVKI